MPTTLTQIRPISEAEAASAASTGRFKALIINAGWGSSGYYAAPVLEAAGTAQVFPAGLQMYLDHPSYTEASDRPERSVKDLAGYLTEAGRWDPDQQGLVAEVQVFGPYREVLAEMADVIGLSIRASAQVETGEAEGRTGTIVTELVESTSVDFVTRAGRGGRLLSAVLESARPAQVVERAVTAGVVEATANDTRDALQNALRDRFTGDQTWVWVRDFDETTVWYELETPDGAGCYQLPYTMTDGAAAVVDGDPIEVAARTEYVPVIPAGQSTTTSESLGGTMAKIEVDEAEYRNVTEAAGRVQALEAERDTARKQLAESKARDKARPIAVTVVGESKIDLPQSTRTRLVESAVTALTVADDGTFDEAAFRTAVEASRTTAEAEAAELLEALGAGRVTGAGHTTTADPVAEAEAIKRADAARARAFGRTPSQEG